MWHCFFEQSGTFKNAFIHQGEQAEDYDILNDFGQTDNVIDLFQEIEIEYSEGGSELFKRIKPGDGIFAFFPCTEFEAQKNMSVRGISYHQRNWDLQKKLEYDLEWMDKMSRNYKILTYLSIICLRRKIKLIVENPKGTVQILHSWWAARPAVVDMDRYQHGDFFKKPTMFFFFGFAPAFRIQPRHHQKSPRLRISEVRAKDGKSAQINKSLISPAYAKYFVTTFILGKNQAPEKQEPAAMLPGMTSQIQPLPKDSI